MKAKRTILMALIIIFILTALFAIFLLIKDMNNEKYNSGVTGNAAIESPGTISSPAADTVPTNEPSNENAADNVDNTPEPTEAESLNPEVTETPIPAIVIENQGDIEIIIPEGQESAGE